MAARTKKSTRKTLKPVEEVMVTEEVVTMSDAPKKSNFRLITLLVLLLGVVSLFWYKTNTWPVAAFVNNKPVFRYQLDQQLYKQGGQQVLDSIITQKLVDDELSKNKVTASSTEVNARINQIKTSLGSSFDSALAAQGMTMDQLKQQVGTQIRIEKLLGDQATASSTEIAQAMKDQNVDATTAAQTLKQQKLQTIIQNWVDGLHAKAKIFIVGAPKTSPTSVTTN